MENRKNTLVCQQYVSLGFQESGLGPEPPRIPTRITPWFLNRDECGVARRGRGVVRGGVGVAVVVKRR